MKGGTATCLFFLFFFCFRISSQSLFANSLTSNAVFQREPQRSNVFGKTNSFSIVELSFNSNNYSTTSDAFGKWKIQLPPMPAGGPYTITAKSIGLISILNNILFGDVYLCAGQSNMEFASASAFHWEELLNSSSTFRNQIRFMQVSKILQDGLQDDIPFTSWYAPDVDPVPFSYFASVCSFAANFTFNSLSPQIPLGFIDSSYGGTIIEQWTPPQWDVCHFNDTVTKMGTVHNAMIGPLEGWRIRGVIWYQGESNAMRVGKYGCQLKNLVSKWRSFFNNSDLFWVEIQISSYLAYDFDFNFLQLLRTVQEETLKNDSKSSVIATYDLGDPYSPFGPIHPRYKREIGYRVAQVMKRRIYGMEEEVDEGPVIQSWKFTLITSSSTFNSFLVQVFLSDPNGLEIFYHEPITCPFPSLVACGQPFDVRIGRDTWISTNNTFSFSDNVISFNVTVPSGKNITDLRYGHTQYFTFSIKNSFDFPLLPYNSFNYFPLVTEMVTDIQSQLYPTRKLVVQEDLKYVHLLGDDNYPVGYNWNLIQVANESSFYIQDYQTKKYITMDSNQCETNPFVVMEESDASKEEQKWWIEANGFAEDTFQIYNKLCNSYSMDNGIGYSAVTVTFESYWYGRFWQFNNSRSSNLIPKLVQFEMGCSSNFKQDLIAKLSSTSVNDKVTVIFTQDCVISDSIYIAFSLSELHFVGRNDLNPNQKIQLSSVEFDISLIVNHVSFENIFFYSGFSNFPPLRINRYAETELVSLVDIDYTTGPTPNQGFCFIIATNISILRLHSFNGLFYGGNGVIFTSGNAQKDSYLTIRDSTFEDTIMADASSIRVILSPLKKTIISGCTFRNIQQVSGGGADVNLAIPSALFIYENNYSFNVSTFGSGLLMFDLGSSVAQIINSTWEKTFASDHSSSIFMYPYTNSFYTSSVLIQSCNFLDGWTNNHGSITLYISSLVKNITFIDCYFARHYGGNLGNVIDFYGKVHYINLFNVTIQDSAAGYGVIYVDTFPIDMKVDGSKFINIRHRLDGSDFYGSCIAFYRNYINEFTNQVVPSHLEISNTQFINCSSNFGELVFFIGQLYDSVSIHDCIFEKNSPYMDSSAKGGIAIYTTISQLSVERNTFLNNSYATGAIIVSSDVTNIIRWNISSNVFLNNSCSEGAPISLAHGTKPFQELYLLNNYLQFNKGRKAGGISIDGGINNVSIHNNVMLDNNAVVQGGGMTISPRAQMYSLNMTNNTISRNFATSNGGGISFAGGINGYCIIKGLLTEGNRVNNVGGGFYLSPSTPQLNFQIEDWESNSNFAAESGGSLYVSNDFLFLNLTNFKMDGNQAVVGSAISFFCIVQQLNLYNGLFSNQVGNSVYFPFAFIATTVNLNFIEMRGNSASVGSNLYVRGFSIFFTVTDCIFEGSNSLDESSISFNQANTVLWPSFFRCIFKNNVGSNRGASLYFATNPTQWIYVQHCNFTSNSAAFGSSIYLSGNPSQLLLFSNLFYQNSATLEGGAIFFGSIPKDTFTFTQNQFIENQAMRGGAILFDSGKEALSFNNSYVENKASEKGGAIFIRNPIYSLLVQDQFWKNVGGEGGAIYSSCRETAQVLLQFSRLKENVGTISGGAIQINGSCIFIVQLAFIEGNNGTERGGGISMDTGAHLIVAQSNISGNIAKLGGGIAISNSDNFDLLTNSVFENNVAQLGGGIYSSFVNSFECANSTFAFNNGTSGGGVYVNNGNAVISSSNFTANTATYRGGSFYLLVSGKRKREERGEMGNMTLNGNEITKNKGGEGGGMFVENMGEEGQVKVEGNEMKNNWGEVGGGIGLIGKLTLNNNVMMGNEANINGSGMYIAGDAQLTDSNNSWNGEDVFIKNGVKFRSSQQKNVQCDRTVLELIGNDFFCPLYIPPTSESILTSGQTMNVISVEKESALSTGALVGIIIGVVAFFIIAIIILVVLLSRKKKKSVNMEDFELNLMEINYNKKVVIDYNDIGEKTKIGQGAYGVVYRAKWRGIDIAMKQIPNQNLTQKSQLEEFLGEVELLQNLRPHPNVVMFIGITVPPHPFSLITELCENGNLVHFIANNKEVANIEFKRKIIGEIALGMYHLHSENIIHRDLAARNILLTKTYEAKVSDFGLSRQQDTETIEGKTKSEVGPLKWMAPESILNRSYSRKSDVYSFGITVWEIIHEKLPYEDMDLLNAAIAVAQEGLRPAISEECPKELMDLMENCWKNDPNDRPSFEDIVSLFSGEVKKTKKEDDTITPAIQYAPFEVPSSRQSIYHK